MAQIFDLHCHPGMKYLMRQNENFYSRHTPPEGTCGFLDPLGIYYDSPGAKHGNVKVLINSYYVPENGLLDCLLLQTLDKIDPNIIEERNIVLPNGKSTQNISAWEKLTGQNKKIGYIPHFEQIITDNNNQKDAPKVGILKDPAEFNTFLEKYDLIIINGIEGAHHLGRNLSDENEYITRLDQFRTMGFCAFTLSHFFLNDICDTGGGIPPSDMQRINYKIPVALTPGLTAIGKKVVQHALNTGFMVDLVHSTREARQDVYKINNSLPTPKPLSFTHTGVRPLYRKGKDATYESLYYLPDDEDIEQIRKSRGIMGLILMKIWLNGNDDDKNVTDTAAGQQIIFDTIDYIAQKTGDYSNIGIGTDLDGFTHVPDDLGQSYKLDALQGMIMKKYGFKDSDGKIVADKILFDNALRVFTECCIGTK